MAVRTFSYYHNGVRLYNTDPQLRDALYYNDRPHKFFRPRRVSPGRVVITPLRADLDPLKLDVPLGPPQRRTAGKVAVSRENARRFIKSVISQNSTADPPSRPSTAKRRSNSPTKRSNSDETSGEDVDTMRTGIRGSVGSNADAIARRHRASSAAENRAGNGGPITNGANGNGLHRLSTSHAPSDIISAMSLDEEKPIASGNGVSVGVILAEPVLFLQGFDQQTENAPGNTAMLRGSLHLRVQKTAKIKAVTLKFRGTSITKWPEGIPPRKVEFEEKDTIMSHTWPFFNAQFEAAEMGTNADHVQLFKGGDAGTPSGKLDPLGRSSPNASAINLTSKEARKLSLQVNQSRSFGKGETPTGGPTVATKGYRMFLPGDYIYNFELPLDSRLPESIDVELGSVKYELEATIERSGAFRANLVGSKEITLIRAPAEGSLEQVEPIAISRNWEDQLHYDIVISGKSFPLGTQVPIAFKLTPLAKVQCHRVKVMVTENIEYFCSNKRVHRMEPTRKVQLFEKRADGPATSTFPGSTMRVTAGGGIPYDARARAARGEEIVPNDTTNLLGNLEGETNIGPTEMEFSVQLPSCHSMKERDRSQRLHFDTTYQNIQVHHWIKIVMRLSKPDKDDPSKRRHFEISIDSPFHILSCRATQTNISLPAYTSPLADQQSDGNLYECGCPGAARRRTSPHSFVPTLNALNSQRTGSDSGEERPTTPTMQSPGLARPPTAHVNGHAGRNGERPIHLLRAPSFNPPPFEDEAPPPPLITPPPQYDSIASPTSGLADYFARLSDAYDEDEDASHNQGRVNIPLTPGGRVNRSMDLGRTWVPVGNI